MAILKASLATWVFIYGKSGEISETENHLSKWEMLFFLKTDFHQLV